MVDNLANAEPLAYVPVQTKGDGIAHTCEEVSKVIKPVIPTRIQAIHRLMLAIQRRVLTQHRIAQGEESRYGA